MQTISDRLGRLCGHKVDLAAVFATAALLVAGGIVGGLIGLFPFLSSSPAHTTKVYYGITLIVAAVFAILLWLARLAIKKERAESIQAIKEDLDKILTSYPAREGV